MLEGTRENFKEISKKENIFKETMLTADSGFHTEENMKMLCSEKIDGYIAETTLFVLHHVNSYLFKES